MPKSLEIAVGDRFGRWTVVGPFVREKRTGGKAPYYCVLYPCRCDCGAERNVLAFKLLRNSRSCGCEKVRAFVERIKTHGESCRENQTRLYRCWSGIKQRCENQRYSQYKDYGGRGIRICDEWRASYPAFKAWAVANGHRDDLEIDRRDNNGGYCPENCRWVTRGENMRNKRDNHLITAFGITLCIEEWGRHPACRVCTHTVRRRIEKYGWDPEMAIGTPWVNGKTSRHDGRPQGLPFTGATDLE